MNFALIGYGKMGSTIESLGKEQGHSFPLIIDLDNQSDLNEEAVRGLDAVIEFSIPAAAPDNVRRCIDLGLPVVSGTTGWHDRVPELSSYCLEKEACFFWASNYSIGVNILFAMNRKLARIMNRFGQYEVSMEECHHIHKLDAPSGTAISLAEQIMEAHEGVNAWDLEPTGDPSTIHIRAIREGEVKGRHRIQYTSPLDSISLEHDARSRDAFAAGALMAAAFIAGKQGVFGMKDLLDL